MHWHRLPTEGYLEAVVVLPERHALVPGVHDRDAQALYHRQRQGVAPAAPHNHPHRRVVALQRVVPQQAHAGQRLAAETLVIQPGLGIWAAVTLVVPCTSNKCLQLWMGAIADVTPSTWACG